MSFSRYQIFQYADFRLQYGAISKSNSKGAPSATYAETTRLCLLASRRVADQSAASI